MNIYKGPTYILFCVYQEDRLGPKEYKVPPGEEIEPHDNNIVLSETNDAQFKNNMASSLKEASETIAISSERGDGQLGAEMRLPKKDPYLVMDDHVASLQRGEVNSSHAADSVYWSHKNQLQGGLIPSTVHYVWCGRRWFEFKHYLSVVSVIRAIRPEQIVFHYDQEPTMDNSYYSLWLGELRKDYPYLKMDHMDDAKICTADHETRVKMILRLVDAGGGGMYVSENTWLTSFSPARRQVDMEFAIDSTSVDGYLLLRAGIISTAGDSWSDIVKNTTAAEYRAKMTSCSPISHLYRYA